MKSQNWVETDFEFKKMLQDWDSFHDSDIQKLLNENELMLNEVEVSFRKFFMIDEIEDRVEDTLKCVLTIG